MIKHLQTYNDEFESTVECKMQREMARHRNHLWYVINPIVTVAMRCM